MRERPRILVAGRGPLITGAASTLARAGYTVKELAPGDDLGRELRAGRTGLLLIDIGFGPEVMTLDHLKEDPLLGRIPILLTSCRGPLPDRTDVMALDSCGEGDLLDQVAAIFDFDAPEWSDDSESRAKPATPKGKILLVGDFNQESCKFVSLILRSAGFEVEVLMDPAQSLRWVRKHSPRIILLYLSSVNLFPTTYAIKSAPDLREIPVFALSGSLDPEDAEYAFLLGVSDYVVTPIDGPELLERVERFWTEAPQMKLKQVPGDLEAVVMDPTQVAAEFMGMVLQGMGMIVRFEDDCHGLIERLRERPPALLVTEYGLRGGTLQDVCQALDADGVLRNLPVLVTTGLRGVELEIFNALPARGAFLRKPFDVASIEDTVVQLLEA